MRRTAEMSALLVEDDATTRALIERQLRRAGVEVLALESGERVLRDAADRYTSFDVVILDIHLPGMSGLELASLIQARRPDQPIIVITGDPDPRLAREALSSGPVSYLLKPFELSQLLAAVERAKLDRSEAAPAASSSKGWLDLVEQSYMGSAHARRVGRVALAVAEALPGMESRLDIGDLLVTAWSHELGRSGSDGDPVAIASEGARVLNDLGSSTKVVRCVRSLAERHDGTGGPGGIAGDEIPLISQVVAVADALEHYAAASIGEEATPAEAVDRGLSLLKAQRGTIFRPEIVDTACRQRSRLITICADSDLMRQGAGPAVDALTDSREPADSGAWSARRHGTG
ncbi:MAG: response regulator [Gemmatimonadetes bacterium]|nr:response regulator [Gemmatimonadota bacterium]